MNWNEQAQQMVKSWTETQKKLWDGWMDAATQHGASGAPAGLWTDWISQWQKMAQQTLESWSAGAGGVPKDVARRLFTGEEAFFRFVELSLEAFKSLAPKIQEGADRDRGRDAAAGHRPGGDASASRPRRLDGRGQGARGRQPGRS